MNTHCDERERESLDTATSRRLAQLATRPVDVASLRQRMRAAVDAERPATRSAGALVHRLRRFSAAAAAVVLIGLIGFLALDAGNTAVAAPTQLAKMYRDVTEGRIHVEQVDSIQQANAALARQSAEAPEMPDQVPGLVMSCCLTQIDGATLSCVLIEDAGRKISVAVADGAAMHSPDGEAIRRGGRELIVHEAEGITMVMTHHAGRWMCVMGDAELDALIDVATRIDF